MFHCTSKFSNLNLVQLWARCLLNDIANVTVLKTCARINFQSPECTISVFFLSFKTMIFIKKPHVRHCLFDPVYRSSDKNILTLCEICPFLCY